MFRAIYAAQSEALLTIRMFRTGQHSTRVTSRLNKTDIAPDRLGPHRSRCSYDRCLCRAVHLAWTDLARCISVSSLDEKPNGTTLHRLLRE
jgi:hypothetical protein